MPSVERLLTVYAGDHGAGATGLVEALRRAAASRRDFSDGPELGRLAAEADADRTLLGEQLAALGAATDRPDVRLKEAGAWLGEKLGRLKPNASLVAPSPLGYVTDLEGVLTLEQYVAAAWRVVRDLAQVDDRADVGVATGALARSEARCTTVRGLAASRAREAFRPQR